MRKILLALAATIAVGCTPEQTAQRPPVTSSARATAPDPTVHLIGVAGPFTGRYGVFGSQLLEGANAAIADINRAGGVLGRPLRAQSVDDACDPGTREDFGPSVRRAVAAARDLVAQGAVLVDGHFCSSSSIVASEVYAGSQAVMISPSSTNYRLTADAAAKGWRHVFRTAPNDERQGDFAAAWLIRHYRGHRVAIVHDDSSYGQRIAAAAQRRLQAADMRIVVMEQIRQSSGGGDALVARLVAEGASSVFFAGYTEDAAKLVRQLREAKWGGAFIGTDALVDAEFWRLAGAAGQGTYATFLADPRRHPRAQSVVAQFNARGINPEGYILFSYAAVQVWAEAARRAGTVDRDRVAAALRGGSFETVLGTLTFDATGDIVDPPYTLYMWNRGEYSEAPTR